ncbi:hypothetical protein TSAR_009075, partial [Trichomalopsis sarcophagae]
KIQIRCRRIIKDKADFHLEAIVRLNHLGIIRNDCC